MLGRPVGIHHQAGDQHVQTRLKPPECVSRIHTLISKLRRKSRRQMLARTWFYDPTGVSGGSRAIANPSLQKDTPLGSISYEGCWHAARSSRLSPNDTFTDTFLLFSVVCVCGLHVITWLQLHLHDLTIWPQHLAQCAKCRVIDVRMLPTHMFYERAVIVVS